MRNGPYILVIAPEDYPGKRYRGRYCYEHHLVYWRTHGVLPGRGELIHHDNEKKHDNRPENLVLEKIGAHNALHGVARRKPIVHGTMHGYQGRKCRCDLCRAANARSAAERRKRTGRR